MIKKSGFLKPVIFDDLSPMDTTSIGLRLLKTIYVEYSPPPKYIAPMMANYFKDKYLVTPIGIFEVVVLISTKQTDSYKRRSEILPNKKGPITFEVYYREANTTLVKKLESIMQSERPRSSH